MSKNKKNILISLDNDIAIKFEAYSKSLNISKSLFIQNLLVDIFESFENIFYNIENKEVNFNEMIKLLDETNSKLAETQKQVLEIQQSKIKGAFRDEKTE